MNESQRPGVVVAEPEIGGGAAGLCSVAEMYGHVIIVHECIGQRGVFYRIISDGPVEVTAPEVRITGKLVVNGDVEITGNTKVTGDTSIVGDLHHLGDARHEGGMDVVGEVHANRVVDRSLEGGFLP